MDCLWIQQWSAKQSCAQRLHGLPSIAVLEPYFRATSYHIVHYFSCPALRLPRRARWCRGEALRAQQELLTEMEGVMREVNARKEEVRR